MVRERSNKCKETKEKFRSAALPPQGHHARRHDKVGGHRSDNLQLNFQFCFIPRSHDASVVGVYHTQLCLSVHCSTPIPARLNKCRQSCTYIEWLDWKPRGLIWAPWRAFLVKNWQGVQRSNKEQQLQSLRQWQVLDCKWITLLWLMFEVVMLCHCS